MSILIGFTIVCDCDVVEPEQASSFQALRSWFFQCPVHNSHQEFKMQKSKNAKMLKNSFTVLKWQFTSFSSGWSHFHMLHFHHSQQVGHISVIIIIQNHYLHLSFLKVICKKKKSLYLEDHHNYFHHNHNYQKGSSSSLANLRFEIALSESFHARVLLHLDDLQLPPIHVRHVTDHNDY